MDSMRGISYLRTSPGTNRGGTSIPGQRDAIESWADERDHEIVEEFVDEGISGRKISPLDRPGFEDAKEFLLRDPQIDFIVAKTKDRFGRQMKDLISLREILRRVHEERHGDERIIEVLTTTGDDLDYSIDDESDEDAVEQIVDYMGDIMKTFMVSYEAAQTSRKTQNSLEEKKRRDEPTGRPPFGLTTDKAKRGTDRATEYLPRDGKFETAILVLNEFDEIDGITPETDEGITAYAAGKKHGVSSPSKTVRSIWERRDLYERIASEHTDLKTTF